MEHNLTSEQKDQMVAFVLIGADKGEMWWECSDEARSFAAEHLPHLLELNCKEN